MNNREVQYIITTLKDTLEGDPWYGLAMYKALEDVEPACVFINPDEKGHALIELLYHVVTWAQFVQNRMEDPDSPVSWFEGEGDWREIDPTTHTWKNGLEALKKAHRRIIEILQTKDDSFLESPVKQRKYNMGYLLRGLVQHNIYHLGQMIYVKKLLA
jgi:uncharacterized damage-inducible protein DinB